MASGPAGNRDAATTRSEERAARSLAELSPAQQVARDRALEAGARPGWRGGGAGARVVPDLLGWSRRPVERCPVRAALRAGGWTVMPAFCVAHDDAGEGLWWVAVPAGREREWERAWPASSDPAEERIDVEG